MVWVQKMGVTDWVERLKNNDPKLTSLTVLRFRVFGHEATPRTFCHGSACHVASLSSKPMMEFGFEAV